MVKKINKFLLRKWSFGFWARIHHECIMKSKCHSYTNDLAGFRKIDCHSHMNIVVFIYGRQCVNI